MTVPNNFRYHVKGWLHWLIYELPKAPRFELFATRMDLINRADRKAGAMTHAFEHYQQAEPLPRIIWMYWDSGEAGMPFVVRRCVESWRRHNPGWDLRILDAQTVSEHVDMSDFPKVKLAQRFYANLLRVRLLQRHGGVWADATVYCHRPLDDWLDLHMMSGFFALKNPGRDRILASWFLVSQPAHPLISLWERRYTAYLKTLRSQPHKYFMFFYALQWGIAQTPKAQRAWDEVASLPAKPALMMMPTLVDQSSKTVLRAQIAAGLPVSKLNWKIKIDEAAFDAFCAGLEGSEMGAYSSKEG